MLQGGSLKAQEQAVLQDEWMGKTTGLAGTQEKKEGLPLMEERASDSRGVQGSC